MEQSKWGDYENYIVMATNTPRLSTSYSTFLDFIKVRTFIKKIASTYDNDTFLYEKTIYSKKITTDEATKILGKLLKNKFDDRIRVVANQLNIRIR